MSRHKSDPQDRQIAATVASESKPYTDPKAQYPTAEQYRRARSEGVARRAA